MDRRRGVGGVRIRGERSLGWCKIRLASLNVGTLTGQFLELVDVLRKKKVDVACIQETRWKGEKTKEANGFKLWYSGLVNSRNGVGILLSTKLKDKVVEIKRCGDRIMYIRLVVGTVIGTVICVYAPQVGLGDIESMAFWGCLDDLVRGIPNDQLLFVGGDFNGHIGASVDGYQGIHGGFGYGVRNEHGSTLLDFATAHDLVIVNSCFRKSDNNLITFRSGGHATQIDYLLIRSRDFRFCSDCQVFPKESCASQHRLLAMDLSLNSPLEEQVRVVQPRILWRNLKGSKIAEFKDMLEGCFKLVDDADQMWTNMANSIRSVARRILGVSSGNVSDHKESWWWNDDVQAKVQFKKGCFLELVSCLDGPDRHIKRELFKVAKRKAKQAVAEAEAKAKAYQDMYRRLSTKEGVNEIFKLAKARNKRRQDICSVRYIKDESDRVLLHDGDITAR